MPRKARIRSLSSTSPATLPNSIPTNRYGTMPKLGWRSGLSRIKRSSKRHCSRSYCLFSVQPDSYSHSSNSLRLSTPQMRSSADTCATVDRTLLIYKAGDDESPWPTHERDPAVFAGVGSGRTHESDHVNKLAEGRSAKPPAARRSREHGGSGIRTTSSPDALKIAADKNGHQNRCACPLH